jgi:3-deoxy-7-phosphoheptulonate synthase
MIVVMEPRTEQANIDRVVDRLKSLGFEIHLSRGIEKTIIGAVGERRAEVAQSIEAMPGVEKVVPILHPFKLAGLQFKPERTIVRVGNVEFGGSKLVSIAGPCAVESREQLLAAAEAVKSAGASMLRGGAFKPRTSPYTFQGLEEDGLKLLAEAREVTGLPIVTEVVNPRDLDLVASYVDMLQIGTRNMQNYTLLREVGASGKPVILKRGLSATIEEWLMAAEYIMSAGNWNVVLCERGIRTFETYTRNTLDISAVPAVRSLSHLPLIVDPSHATGRAKLVPAAAMAALAAGADGLLIEVHPCPSEALSDGPQSLTPSEFADLMHQMAPLAAAIGRQL